MATTVDAKHQQLVNDFEKLNNRLNLFINGEETDTVQLDSGAIKTLAGISSSLQKFKYVQKIIDHKLYADMIAADVNIDIGLLVRIWGDTSLVNGLYKKTATNTYVKISYQDIYDLRDYLPNPWNNIQIKKDKTQFDQRINLLTFSLPYNSVDCFDAEIKGNFKITSDQTTFNGSYRTDFVVHTVAGTTVVQNIVLSNTSKLNLDSNFSTVVVPSLILTVSNDGVNNNYTLAIDPLKDGSSNIVPCVLELQLFGLDTKFYNIL